MKQVFGHTRFRHTTGSAYFTMCAQVVHCIIGLLLHFCKRSARSLEKNQGMQIWCRCCADHELRNQAVPSANHHSSFASTACLAVWLLHQLDVLVQLLVLGPLSNADAHLQVLNWVARLAGRRARQAGPRRSTFLRRQQPTGSSCSCSSR